MPFIVPQCTLFLCHIATSLNLWCFVTVRLVLQWEWCWRHQCFLFRHRIMMQFSKLPHQNFDSFLFLFGQSETISTVINVISPPHAFGARNHIISFVWHKWVLCKLVYAPHIHTTSVRGQKARRLQWIYYPLLAQVENVKTREVQVMQWVSIILVVGIKCENGIRLSLLQRKYHQVYLFQTSGWKRANIRSL